MLKKIASGFMLSFLCFVQLSCCNSIQNNYKSSKDVYVSYLNSKFNKNQNNVINQNFVFMTKYILTKNQNDFTKICYEKEDRYNECKDTIAPINSASGYVVKVDKKRGKLYALTAAHWCEPANKDDLYDITEILFDKMPLIGYYATFMGVDHRITKYTLDYQTDLCLVTFSSKYYKYAKNSKVAKSDPIIGDKVYTISAPQWSYEDEFRQHYQGLASGCDDHECAFTLPATYGSSGSAIINENGEIISVLSRAAVDFNNYTLGTKPEKVKDFLERAYETLR